MPPSPRKVILYHPQWQGSSSSTPSVQQGALALRNHIYHTHKINFIDIDPDSSFSEEDYIDPDDPSNPRITNLAALLHNSAQITDMLSATFPSQIFTLGGDCGVSLHPVFWLNNHCNAHAERLAVLYFDAHADLNSPETSPSGNFHGMVLRSIIEGRDVEQMQSFVGVRPEQVLLLGARDLDPAEEEYVAEQGISLIEAEALAEMDASPKILRILRDRGLSKVYVHVDVDVFGPENFAYSYMKVPGGVQVGAVRKIIADLRWSADVEVVGGSMKEVDGEIGSDPQALQEMGGLFALLCGNVST